MAQTVGLRCPSCDRGYLLPRQLLGTLGARVSCPGCGSAFEVDREGRVEPGSSVAAPPGAAARPRAQEAHASLPGERDTARAVLDELAARLGPPLEQAALDGQLFARHGPDLMAAYDEYRRRAGAQAGTQAFREELLRRWRVDLFPLAETRG